MKHRSYGPHCLGIIEVETAKDSDNRDVCFWHFSDI
jgi:hypothetical protein